MNKYCVFIKNNKRPIMFFEDRCPSKIIIIFGKNDDILISHQIKLKMKYLQRYK